MRHTMNLQPKWQPVAARLLAVLFLLTGGVTRAQILLDFDTTAPTTSAELPDFFDLFGFDAEFGDDPFWRVNANTVNSDNDSKALHTTSNGNELEGWFSRVAILKPGVFVGEDVVFSADITWDDNDNAGVYVRFSGDSDVPLDNTFYHVRGTANGDVNGVRLHKVIDGTEEQLARGSDIAITEGETHNLRVNAMTKGDTVEITVSIDGQPIPGMDPFVDANNPILGAGRVGVGQETNPTFFDNISIIGIGPDFKPGDFNSDGVVDLADFLILADNFGTGNTFAQGDNNLDLRVDLKDWVDFRELLNAPAGAEGVGAVPEPGSLALMCLAGSALLVVRRRHHHFRR